LFIQWTEGVEEGRYARDSVPAIFRAAHVHVIESEKSNLKAKNSRQFKTVWDDTPRIVEIAEPKLT
jgi:hypothetical protein